MNITVPINRNRLPIAFTVGLLVTILYVRNLIHTQTENTYMNGLFNWIFNSIVLLLVLSFTIIALSEYIKIRFNKNAMLQVSDTYLYDNLSIFSCGKITWSDISSVETMQAQVFNTDLLVIKVFDNEKYLAGKNFVQRHVLKRLIKKWGSPIIISGKSINYNLDELKQIILTSTSLETPQ